MDRKKQNKREKIRIGEKNQCDSRLGTSSNVRHPPLHLRPPVGEVNTTAKWVVRQLQRARAAEQTEQDRVASQEIRTRSKSK